MTGLHGGWGVRVGLALIAGFALACRPRAQPTPAGDPAPPPPPIPEAQAPALALDQVQPVLEALLGDGQPLFGLRRTRDEDRALRILYQDGGLLWLAASGLPRPIAREALALLLDCATEGLNPGDYAATVLDSLATVFERGGRDPTMAARFDLGVSLATLRYLRHLHSGRIDPRQAGFRFDPPADPHDFGSILATALATGGIREVAEELRPQIPQYRQLREALARYRSLAAFDSGDSLRLSLPLRPGDSVPGLASLAGRLRATGDLANGEADTSVYSGALEAAVRRFQARHGLAADGVVGRETAAELNVPIAWRVRQLVLAQERLRWVPDLSAGPFVLVNIPMFELLAFDSLGAGAPAFRTGVIVGRALGTQTPVLLESMRYLIFQPYWNVPASILRNEILPALRRNPDYLRRHDMEIVQGPGDDALPLAQTPENLARLEGGQLRLRQRPGPRNALGRIKFIFPNDANVYLHDTPAQELFSRARRDFSHGCVRVEDPVGLAQYVLRGLPEWTPETIREAMTRGPRSRRVNLPRPIPVVLFYTTAAVETDGRIRFAPDIYGHDRVLDRALAREGGR